MRQLKLTLPKGSLEKGTLDIFQAASYKIAGHERTYRPVISDPSIELKLLRPQEIPIYVADGVFDAGVTGMDWILETGSKVKNLLDLEYGRVKIVSAIPEGAKVASASQYLDGIWRQDRVVRISTEYLNLASKYLKSLSSYRSRFGEQEPTLVTPWWSKGKNSKALIYLSFGATEAKPPEDADMIVEVTETGTSLEQNNLKPMDTILESSASLISNPLAMNDPWKREKLLNLLALLKGVVEARKRVHIFVNVREENLATLLKELPALKRPTVSPLSEKGWYALNTVVEKSELQRLISTLRRLAQGLVVHEPQQVLPLDEIGAEGESK